MDVIVGILTAFGSAVQATKGAIFVGQWLTGHIRERMRLADTAKVLKALRDLGCLSDADVRGLVENWKPDPPVGQDIRNELVALLTNLVRGARFHTTQGTPLSSYLRCERLIDQLLANLQPRRRAGEPVAPGWKDWRLERFLGMGAFGEVWLGRHPRYPDPRAFKFFTIDGAKEWLDREAHNLYHVADRLRGCPNVIGYDNIVLDGEPFPFLVLEYIGGGSLEDWLLAPEADRPAISVPGVMAGMARGLADAHRHKICHRDLKPANVLLTPGPDADPKIADFGLGQVEPDRPDGSSAYASQLLAVGTRMYLPPEAADLYQTRSSAQDDVFAFGVVWYQVLTGRIERPPYDFADRLHKEGVDSRNVRLLSRCLAHPSRRFGDAVELAAALDADVAAAEWAVPEGCFDVGPLAKEYLDSLAR
ncbi:MAG TPA: serine/threonine-protein kinase [Gemmataceae bacterium]|nr:serine/threonine-protein kinase [Gemmataceae bacterium]